MVSRGGTLCQGSRGCKAPQVPFPSLLGHSTWCCHHHFTGEDDDEDEDDDDDHNVDDADGEGDGLDQNSSVSRALFPHHRHRDQDDTAGID